ncbi:glycosyl transferase [Pseudolysinimonas kribbensis]|nr:glycosyl transferase [Pseudolysinimonas kribbensis]
MLDRALAATEGIEHHRFGWRRALAGRYDAIHFHWPETLFNARSPLRRLAKRWLFVALILRLRVSRTAVVRTVHNLQPPTGLTPLQRWLLSAVDLRTDLRILIGETTELPPGLPTVTILHGDYRPWFAGITRRSPIPGRLAFVGLIRRYKGVETLITSFRGLRGDGVSLAVSGNPTSDELADEIRGLAAEDPRVVLRLEFLDDADFVAAMTEGSLVALPYRFMHNSGSVLAALSLDRPVLVPRNDANEALATEVGPGWISMYDGELDTAALDAALDEVSRPRAPHPDLSRRGWERTGERHAQAYARAVRLRRGGASAVPDADGEPSTP